MRAAMMAAVMLLSACADDKLKPAPPPGVDFSGHWQLNEAESDDPQHLADAQSGRGGHGSHGGGAASGGAPSGGAAPGYGGYAGPAAPPLVTVGEGLRWPGKRLEIKQVAGVVAFTSDGRNRVCQPGEPLHRHPEHPEPSGRDDRLPAARDAPPPRCGWSERTLIIQVGDPDDDRPPIEERYSVSEDSQRLVEMVSFKGGSSDGFTVSRVWDRIP
jgi:hypothetical protein